jgi:hypothetical protein
MEYKSSMDEQPNDQQQEESLESIDPSDDIPIFCSVTSMSYGTPGQFFTGTTSVSEYGIVHHSGGEPARDDYFGR